MTRSRSLHYDRQGQPISMQEWLQLLDGDDRTVAVDTIGAYVVSTVWLGIDHSFGGSVPLIFETMVFADAEWRDRDRDGLRDLDCWRYATEDEARTGHADVVTLVRATSVDVPTGSDADRQAAE